MILTMYNGKGLDGYCAFINMGDGIEDEHLTDWHLRTNYVKRLFGERQGCIFLTLFPENAADEGLRFRPINVVRISLQTYIYIYTLHLSICIKYTPFSTRIPSGSGCAIIPWWRTSKITVFFEKHATFAPTIHRRPTPDKNNVVTQIDRESSSWYCCVTTLYVGWVLYQAKHYVFCMVSRMDDPGHTRQS